MFNWTNFEAGTQRIFSGKKTQTVNQTGLSLLQQTASDEREIQFELRVYLLGPWATLDYSIGSSDLQGGAPCSGCFPTIISMTVCNVLVWVAGADLSGRLAAQEAARAQSDQQTQVEKGSGWSGKYALPAIPTF